MDFAGQRLPLEADTSLALAMLCQLGARYRGLLNMPRLLRGGSVEANRGLFLLAPNNPGWKAGGANGSDSVVAYWSSHVDGATSELVMRADHLGLHKHVPAISEVRRILLEHLKTAP